MKINVPFGNRGNTHELLEFKEINQGFFLLAEKPKFAKLKKGDPYFITLGAPVATKIQSLAELVVDTLSKEEVKELISSLRS